MLSNFALGLISLSFVVLYVKIRRSHKMGLENPDRLPYPPGPTPLPVIGNLLDLARGDLWEKVDGWSKEYGGIVHLSAFGRHYLFVNSYDVALDLFDKRSANYSDRAHSIMLHELMGWEWAFGLMPYGNKWKSSRRVFHREFQPSSIPKHHPTHVRAARRLLQSTLKQPERFVEHLKYHAGSTIMKVVYDIDSKPTNDPYISTAERALQGMFIATQPGRFFVDIFLPLKYVPEWVPGAGFQKLAKVWRGAVLDTRDIPFQKTRQATAAGHASPCFVSSLLQDLDTSKMSATEREREVEMIKGCAGMAYTAATESTVSLLHAFLLAMVTHPTVQARARAEIDSVLHHHRLPEFSDRSAMPYCSALVRELLRWAQVAPTAVPHKVTNNDVYNGRFIKAGTIIIGNARMMLHDERTFSDPWAFKPERFYGPEGKVEDAGIVDVAFGFGRRICAGRFMADAQLWIVVVSMLSVFEMRPIERERPPKVEFTKGMQSHPVPFKFTIEPRSDYAAQQLIEEMELEFDVDTN